MKKPHPSQSLVAFPNGNTWGKDPGFSLPEALSTLSILSITWYEVALDLRARIFPSRYFCAHNLCEPLGTINP